MPMAVSTGSILKTPRATAARRCSIRQMIEKMARDHDIDRSSIFVTGLSAGGAMTSVMLATYPEVFAGGAIIAGLPYGVATNVSQALNDMFQAPEHSARRIRRSGAQVPRGIRARGQNCPSGMERRQDRQSRRMHAKSSSSGSPCMICRPHRRCNRRSMAIRIRRGGMRTAKPLSSPTPSPAWRMVRRSG